MASSSATGAEYGMLHSCGRQVLAIFAVRAAGVVFELVSVLSSSMPRLWLHTWYLVCIIPGTYNSEVIVVQNYDAVRVRDTSK